jgi:hypothetical protein
MPMDRNQTDHFVRARDGALYKNPVVVFDEGFIVFDVQTPAELVLWVPAQDSAANLTRARDAAQLVLDRVIGPGHWGNIDGPRYHVRAVPTQSRPDMTPQVSKPAAEFFFMGTRRIPRPKIHDGIVKHASRLDGVVVIDYPSDPHDAKQLNTIERFEPPAPSMGANAKQT